MLQSLHALTFQEKKNMKSLHISLQMINNTVVLVGDTQSEVSIYMSIFKANLVKL
jgi:beta-lactamase superfamily II metal-dependent hydrolase